MTNKRVAKRHFGQSADGTVFTFELLFKLDGDRTLWYGSITTVTMGYEECVLTEGMAREWLNFQWKHYGLKKVA